MDRPTAIEKVKKLRALASPESGAFPAEREVAEQRITSIMETHGLTEADISGVPPAMRMGEVFGARPHSIIFDDVAIANWGAPGANQQVANGHAEFIINGGEIRIVFK